MPQSLLPRLSSQAEVSFATFSDAVSCPAGWPRVFQKVQSGCLRTLCCQTNLAPCLEEGYKSASNVTAPATLGWYLLLGLSDRVDSSLLTKVTLTRLMGSSPIIEQFTRRLSKKDREEIQCKQKESGMVMVKKKVDAHGRVRVTGTRNLKLSASYPQEFCCKTLEFYKQLQTADPDTRP